jgi:hypothetical protein
MNKEILGKQLTEEVKGKVIKEVNVVTNTKDSISVVRIKCEGGKSIIFEFVNNRGIEVSTK